MDDDISPKEMEIARKLTHRYSLLWSKIPGMAPESVEDWPHIPITRDQELHMILRMSCPLSFCTRTAVDTTFDTLRRYGHIGDGVDGGLFSLRVFVVFDNKKVLEYSRCQSNTLGWD
jgi:hypothetical protein